MKEPKHRANGGGETHTSHRTLDEAYILLTIAWATPLSKYGNPEAICKYYILSNQTLNPYHHENA